MSRPSFSESVAMLLDVGVSVMFMVIAKKRRFIIAFLVYLIPIPK